MEAQYRKSKIKYSNDWKKKYFDSILKYPKYRDIDGQTNITFY